MRYDIKVGIKYNFYFQAQGLDFSTKFSRLSVHLKRNFHTPPKPKKKKHI